MLVCGVPLDRLSVRGKINPLMNYAVGYDLLCLFSTTCSAHVHCEIIFHCTEC